MKIDAETAETVQRRQAETGRLFGETAIEMGLASAESVRRAVEVQQGLTVLEHGDDRLSPLVVAGFDPADPLARAARDIRGTISGARRADGGSVQTVGIVAEGSASESIVLVANLAVACAQAGLRTLLVDVNLDQGQHAALFRVAGRTGVSTLLSTPASAATMVQETAIPLLSLLAAGPSVPNAPELLDRRRLAQAIEPLLDSFDLLLVDSSRNAGLDACFGLDAVIVVVREGVSRLRETRDIVARLQENGTAVIGTVIAS